MKYSKMFFRQFCYCISFILLFACNSSKKKSAVQSVNLSPVIHIADTKDFSPAWSTENTLVVHLTSEPDNLHPSNGGSSPRSEILLQTQAYLLNTDYENQTFAPDLVTALPLISEDGLAYTYTLRKEPRWDNGDAITVEDVIFTAKAHKCPLTNNPSVKGYWQNLKDILPDNSDPMKFTMLMKEYSMQNLSFVTGFCIMQRSFHDPKNILKNYSMEQLDDTTLHAEKNLELLEWSLSFNDDKFGRDINYLNGLGQYKVVSWESGQSITLEKKKDHWTKNINNPRLAAYPEKLVFKINKDENSVQLEFKTQTLDVSTNMSMGTFLSLAEDPSIAVNYNHVLSLTYNYTFLAFNQKPDGQKRNKLFTDKNVRRAFAHLSPVDDLIKLVYKEYASYCKRMVANVSPLKPGFNKELKPIEFDTDRATELLKDAGWVDSDKNGILDKEIDGKKVQFIAELAYMNTSSDWKDMASMLAESFAKVGIKVELIPMDLRVFLESMRNHDFDMSLGSWGGTPFPEDFTQLWHSSSWLNNGSNYSGFGNDVSDALIDSIKAELDTEKRNAMTMRFQEMIYEDQPYVFLYCSMRRNLIHKRFGNVSLFADRPGMLINTFKLLSTNNE
ncbi:MAG TPA: ABC transporter substrate-binding protein [Bacteroidia bacterium]|nr:ABC transporter substrate-binding protein [Bacteroidia bacterium]